MTRATQPDVYFSVDVETDGSIPGVHSMLSFGICLAGFFDGHEFVRTEPRERSLYRELAPITGVFEPAAMAVNGLDREELIRSGGDPAATMDQTATWIEEVAGEKTPVFVAYPLSFDWMFFYWYLRRFDVDSPFGHSSTLDMKSMSASRGRTVVGKSGKKHLPEDLLPRAPHTHDALDDAIEQAELFQNLFTWSGIRSVRG